MRFVDRFLENLAKIHEESNDNFKAREVRNLKEHFKHLIEEEDEMIKKAFIDGYGSELNAHSSKAKILSQLYFKENYQ